MDNIKYLTNDDILTCAFLYKNLFTAAPWNESWDETSAKLHLEEIFNTPGFLGLGYFDNNNDLQGFIIGICESWLAHKQFYVNEMCVDNKHQGKGIGTLLMQRLKEELKSRNISKMYLLTLRDSNAQHFYQKHSFIESEKMIVMGCKI